MYFLLQIDGSPNPRPLSPPTTTVLPDLLVTDTTRESYFDGRAQISYGGLPGSFAQARVGTKLILVGGHVRRPGVPESLEPEQVLERLGAEEESFGGQYLIAVYDDDTRRVDVYTTLSRLVPAYFAIHTGRTLVSTRQAVLAEQLGSSLEPQAIYPFLGEGYLPHEGSLFQGVSLAPAHARVSIKASGAVHTVPLSDTLDRIGAEQISPERLDALAGALRRSFAPTVAGAEIEIGLTAGRDSRLMAALLRSSGTEFRCYTRGAAAAGEDREVTVARIVAETLNVEHAVFEGSDSGAQEPDRAALMQRLSRAAVNADFSVFGYENVGSKPRKYSTQRLFYNGGGGEFLRVAYGDDAWLSASKAEARILKHASGVEHTEPSLSDPYTEWLGNWVSANQGLTPAALLNKFSLLYRTGRWGSAMYGATFVKPSQRPYYDNEVLQLLLPLDSSYAASDVLYYEMLHRLAPELLTVPFGDRPWALDRADSRRYRRIARSLPEPLTGKRTRAPNPKRKSWRRAVNGPLGAELLRVAETGAANLPALSGVRIESLRDALESAGSSPGGPLVKRLWATASMAVFAAQASGDLEVFDR